MNKYLKWITIAVVIAAILYPFGRRGLQMYRYTQAINEITLTGDDFSNIEDGVYQGNYDAILVRAEVTVHMQNGMIQDIEYEHEHERGERGEQVIDYVLEEQSLQVDTVSGATDSSKVLLKAVENALFE